jgi:Leucine-rich repeat (LRR) protein
MPSLPVSVTSNFNLVTVGDSAAIETIAPVRGASPEVIRKLAALPGLRRVVTHAPVTEAQLEAICSLARVEELELSIYSGRRQGDKGMSHLGSLINLRRLNLSGAGVSDSSLPYIRSLKSLEELNLLFNYGVTDAGLRALGCLVNLRSLEVSGLGPLGLSALRNLPRFERLEVTVFDPGDGDPDLSALRGLKWLRICSVHGDGTPPLRLPQHLQRLHTDFEMMAKLDLQSARHIEWLRIDTTPSNGEEEIENGTGPSRDWEWLRSLPELKELTVTNVERGDLPAIAEITSLKGLTLRGSESCLSFLKDTDLKTLAGLRELESLSIYGSASERGMDVLRGFTRLRQLDIQALALTPEGMGAVWELRRLRSLKLRLRDPALHGSVDAILARMKALPELEELSLSASLTDSQLGALADLAKLRRLDLSRADGYTAGGLADLMNAMPNLRELTFTSCKP